MIRLIVDSGSSIKPEEKEKYNVDIIPIRITLGEEDFLDGENLDIDYFYKCLIEKKIWPKTSLPNLAVIEDMVDKYVDAGDEVIIITISQKISGTYNAINMLFNGNEHVHVVDSRTAVGGIRILVDEVNKYRDRSVGEIIDRINMLIPKIVVAAIPETLNYLHKGGRLSRTEWLIGSVVGIKPIIGLVDGYVKMTGKKVGIVRSMKAVCEMVNNDADTNYGIVGSYTYKDDRLQQMIQMLDDDKKKAINAYDNLDPAIACHWGPNAFGFIYVKK